MTPRLYARSAPRLIHVLAGSLAALALLAACGGAAPVASPPASSPPAPASLAAASKPAPASALAPASAKPSTASSGAPSAAAKPAGSASSTGSTGAVSLPALPALVPVTLDGAASSYLVLDITSNNCQTRPSCVDSLPAISSLLKRARDAKAQVIYTNISQPGATILSQIAPQQGEPVLTATGADKFLGSNLDDLLKQRKTTTVVLVGTSGNGAVLYATYASNERGYTAVVAVDGISSSTPFDNFLAEYQVLHQPSFTNPDNKPLQPKAATLSRGDLITFK